MDNDRNLCCGAAKRIITPPTQLLPMPKNAGGIEFGGVLDDLYVRVLALRSGIQTVLFVSFDLGGVPNTNHFLDVLSEHTGVPEANIFYFATHTHTSPNAGRPDPDPSRVPSKETTRKHNIYLQLLEQTMCEAAQQALTELRPARLGFATGASYINVNRNQMYKKHLPDGTVISHCALGVNPEGPSDKTLFVLKAEALDGSPIAFFVNYAVHAVVMHANRCFGERMAISSDLPGNVSIQLEAQYPGAIALWSSGAAGDQNAILMNQVYLPDPCTGEHSTFTMEGGNTDLLRILVQRHLFDIKNVLEQIHCKEQLWPIRTAIRICSVPGRNVIPDDPSRPRGACHYETDDAAPYRVRMQLLRLGDLAFVGISGELYTRLGLHLKKISPCKNTVLITHNAICYRTDEGDMINCGYIYDDESMAAGAFGSARTRMRPGHIREALADTLNQLFIATL